MKLQRVDHTAVGVIHRLNALQASCLPGDAPCDYKPDDLWWVAREAGVDIAFACIRPLTSIEGWWYLARAGVDWQHQGKGIQTKLIRIRCTAAKKAGGTMVVTDTSNHNYPSSNSLINAGFKLYGPTTRWSFPDALYWRKKL